MFWANVLLFLSWLLALSQCWLPFRRPLPTLGFARCLSGLQHLLVAFLFFSLMWAFARNDFSLAYVAANSNRHLPLFYRLCAVWGGHEGSILLWIFILTLWTSIFVFFRRTEQLIFLQVNAVLAAISAGFLLFAMTLSNPFLKLSFFPEAGQDLNPLLQDPGLIFHPPLLYMGYVGFAVTFAWAMAALWQGQFDRYWARWMQPWTLVAWCFLTLGIISGSWWAYRVLGWGGWWFWDPVENVSLLPWLAGTALVHSLYLLKHALYQSWVLLLAILTFALSLFGTFIVRSGILVSVHTFAMDPSRGFFMLGLFGFFVGAALLLYALQNKKIVKAVMVVHARSTQQSLLLINNLLFGIMLFTVLLGTLYPLLIELVGLGKLSIGAPYFNTVLTPFAALLLFVVAFPSFLDQKKYQSHPFFSLLFWFILSVVISVIEIVIFTHHFKWAAFLGLTLANWILLSIFSALWGYRQKKQTWKKIFVQRGAMLFAHGGVALSAIGIILNSLYSEQYDVQMQIGDSIRLANQAFTLRAITEHAQPNYHALIAQLVSKTHPEKRLQPELRYYPFSGVTLSKPAIDATFFLDRYAALAESFVKQTWTFRFYTKPFIRWIWLGGLLMILGGISAVFVLPKYRQRSSLQ